MFWFRKKKGVAIDTLRIAADIHTHLIPGVDDGRFTPESAAATLARMYAGGTETVCLTPHRITGVYECGEEVLNDGLRKIITCAGRYGTIPRLSLAAEYMVDEAFLSHIGQGGGVLALPGGHVLVEMSYYAASPQIFDAVSCLSRRGYRTILAHPERYTYMDERMEGFDRLYDMGCSFQLNLLSVTGIYGEASMRIMRRLFERSYYEYVGSDLHSPEQFDMMRSSVMSEETAREGRRASLWDMA